VACRYRLPIEIELFQLAWKCRDAFFWHRSTSPKVTWVRLCAWQRAIRSVHGRPQPHRPRFQFSVEPNRGQPPCLEGRVFGRTPSPEGCQFGPGSDRNKSFRPRIFVLPTWLDLETFQAIVEARSVFQLLDCTLGGLFASVSPDEESAGRSR
jgi:hypothetical protein